MLYAMVTFTPGLWFAGFGVGFFIGFLASLIKYIITAFARWTQS